METSNQFWLQIVQARSVGACHSEMMIEVTVRFGDTILEVVTCEQYVVGDVPGANLPIAGVPAQTITDGFIGGRPQFGHISLAVARPAPVKPVPRAPIELRPYAYGALSIAMHLALWIAATSEGRVDDTKIDKGAQKTHLVSNHASMPMATKADVDQPKLPTDDPANADEDREQSDPSIPTTRMQLGDDPVDQLPDETDDPARPDRPEEKVAESKDTEPCGRDCGIIKTGAYATEPSSRGAGADFELAPRRPIDVSVVGCRVGEGCKTAQGNDQADLRAVVENHLEGVMACFSRGGTKAVIDFQIDTGGKFKRDQLPEHTPDASDCIADILANVPFPRPTDGEPRKVTLAFARD